MMLPARAPSSRSAMTSSTLPCTARARPPAAHIYKGGSARGRSTMTAAVPSANARGTVRPGSRSSSAMYPAAFHPAYVNITGISASSHDAGETGPADTWRLAAEPAPMENPSAMNISSAETLSAASTLPTTRPGPDAAHVNPRQQRNGGQRHQRLARKRQRHPGDRNDEQRSAVRRAGKEPAEIERQNDGAGGNRAGKAGDKRRPAGEKRRQPAERRVQVDVFAARARPQRGQLRVGHGAGKRQRAAGHPRRQETRRAEGPRRPLAAA